MEKDTIKERAFELMDKNHALLQELEKDASKEIADLIKRNNERITALSEQYRKIKGVNY